MTAVRDPTCDVLAIVRDPVRLAEVRRTGLVDSPPEESLDRLTRLASRLVGAPAGFITLVDEARDFYKSQHGFGEPLASTRELTGLTFCHYAVAGSEPLVISDARAHPVYSQVPTVETLGVAAYLGMPLVTSRGQAVGSFCVIDFEPHEWCDLDVEVIRELAGTALREIELRLALRDAESARKRMEEAIRAREEVAAMLSYDLRNPIHAVRSSASMLLELPIPDDERRRFLEIIHRNADAVTRLIVDLLDISMIEGGQLRVELTPIDPTTLVREAVDMLAPTAAGRGLELRVEAAPGVPPVLADRTRMQQVLANLIGNALKFTPAGGRVVVRVAPREDDVLFSVSDSGQGIAPEHITRVFDRFWQASRTKRSGAGLGLAIVHGIVRAHGGAVGVESTPGVGSTFSFSIPRASVAATPEVETLAQAAPG